VREKRTGQYCFVQWPLVGGLMTQDFIVTEILQVIQDEMNNIELRKLK
jgi:hypothetical protein